MRKINFWFLTLVFLSIRLSAQVFPSEGIALNYRIIGFSVPAQNAVKKYKIEIAAGHHTTLDSFKRKIVATEEGREAKMIAKVPEFGKEYTWRVLHDGKPAENNLHHFSTRASSTVDTTKIRLRVRQPAEKFKDYYVMVDRGGVMYDMNGEPVWFLPDPDGQTVGNAGDLRMTKDGTVTFIYGYSVEVDYNGKVLWKTPKRGTIRNDSLRGEIYHHEFYKMSNGHYMALVLQMMYCKTVTVGDSSYIISTSDDNTAGQYRYLPAKFGCLVEYNENGDVVWNWMSMDYLFGSDFPYYNPADSNMRFDAHDNAFYFDEKNSAIYLGFKNINRIIKIDYPSGKVSQEYGEKFKSGLKQMGKGFFCGQHNISRTADGYLCVFNNNTCSPAQPPKLVLLQEPATQGDTIRKIWEYDCSAPSTFTQNYYQGGNAIPLTEGYLFANMGSKYSKMFIVGRDKKVVWMAFPERFVETDGKWMINYQYRANIFSRNDLEKFIWSAQVYKK